MEWQRLANSEGPFDLDYIRRWESDKASVEPVEWALAVLKRGVAYHKCGGPDMVSIGPIEGETFTGAVVSHTHPSGTSPTSQDVAVFLRFEERLDQFRVAMRRFDDNAGPITYVFTKPFADSGVKLGGDPRNEVARVFSNARGEVSKEFPAIQGAPARERLKAALTWNIAKNSLAQFGLSCREAIR